METLKIIVDQNKCTGCRICQFICSSLHNHEFNPSKAYIVILDEYEISPIIQFSDECNNCGQCARNCLYGALKLESEEML
jgi:Fe-S-cluster-containing dehydrogenase component